MKKVVAYARISNEDQSNFSISGQVEKITEYCYRNNYHLVDTFIDEGQSAKDFDRKAWKRLENFLKLNHKHIDYFVVLKYDRFSRNLQQALTVIQKFEDKINTILESKYYKENEDKLSANLIIPQKTLELIKSAAGIY